MTTSPPGAEVFVRGYDAIDDEWQSLGRTPLAEIGVGAARAALADRAAGVETVELATTAQDDDIGHRAIEMTLHAVGAQPPEMVYVPGGVSTRSLNSRPLGDRRACAFLHRPLRSHEQSYQGIRRGGRVRAPQLLGRSGFQQGRPTVVLRRGHDGYSWTRRGGPGQSTWELGDYPEGQDEYPVTGISWYEAVGLCPLPREVAADHVPLDDGRVTRYRGSESLAASILPLSNFGTRARRRSAVTKASDRTAPTTCSATYVSGFWNSGPSGGWVVGGGLGGSRVRRSVARRPRCSNGRA